MRNSWKDTFRFSLSLQMLGMVILLVLSCTLLVKVYAGVIQSSRSTMALNESVQACRSLAEIYTSAPRQEDALSRMKEAYGSLAEDGSTYIVFLDKEGEGCEEAEAFVKVNMSFEKGDMSSLHLSAMFENEEIYQLSVDAWHGGEVK